MPERFDSTGETVGRVAARLGVTTRTLHHWDEIGLAQPSFRSRAGYRLYTAEDVERLERIMIYREVGLDLRAIREVLDNTGADAIALLRDGRGELAEKIARLQQLDRSLERMIQAHEHGILLTPAEQVATLGGAWNPAWPSQARDLYGHTAQWQQYAEQSATRDAADWKAVADASQEFERALVAAMRAAVEPGSIEAAALVEEHRAVFSAYFPLTREMQVCLGHMYEADPAYRAHYDGIHEGLAAWFRRIIDASARAHGIDPDTATWG